MNITVCDVCGRTIERVLDVNVAYEWGTGTPKVPGARFWIPIAQHPERWMYQVSELCPSCILDLSAFYLGIQKAYGQKTSQVEKLKEAVQNLLKAPHNSFNDAMWREKIKELLSL